VVDIPIKTQIEIAIVLEIVEENNLNIDKSKIKSIISIKNDNIFLKNYQFNLVKWVAKYYFSSIHNSLNLFFPKNVKDKIGNGKLLFNKYINDDSYILKNKINLSENQKKAFDEINKSENNKVLLY